MPGVDGVLQESAKLAAITRERRRRLNDGDGEPESVFELRDVAVTYGPRYAVSRASACPSSTRDHSVDRPFGVWQDDGPALSQPHERPDPEGQGRGDDPLPRNRPLRSQGRAGRGPQADRHGLPEAEPVPQVHLRQHRLRPSCRRIQGRHGRAGRTVASTSGALGRGEARPQGVCDGALRRPAAASTYNRSAVSRSSPTSS